MRCSEEKPKLSTTYDSPKYLAGQSCTFDALGIAEAVLFLWKEHFETDPLYEQVTTILSSGAANSRAGSQRRTKKLPITEELSKI
jgi:hypothetical protein